MILEPMAAVAAAAAEFFRKVRRVVTLPWAMGCAPWAFR
jgi:hypothetical protein